MVCYPKRGFGCSNGGSIESVEDEDEVLTALGDELGNFVDYVGGPEYGHVLLSPLENLAAIEEPLVREKASRLSFTEEGLTFLGRREPEQNLRSDFEPAGREELHPPPHPSLQSRLVYVQGLGDRSIRSPVQKGLDSTPTRASTAVRRSRSR
jgi:hypothetical protein